TLLLGQRQKDGGGPVPPDPKPVPDREDLRQVIMGRLAITPGMTSFELSTYYVEYAKTKGAILDEAACRPQLEQAAWEMHHEGHIHVTLAENGLFLLPRKR